MINKMQDLYISLFAPFIRLSNRISDKVRYAGLTACFIINIIMFCIVQLVLKKENYFYNSFCGIFLLMVIIFLLLDKPLKRIPWHRGMFVIWMLLSITMTISDLFVLKQTCGLGIILGFLFTGLFFAWQNHSRRDLLWKSFRDSLQITFLFMAVASFLFRPYFEGGRYAGIFTNPNTFGLYLVVIFCIYLSQMDWLIETNRPIVKQIWCYIQMALVLFFISVSQARTAMIAAFAMFVLWIVCRIYIDHKRHCYRPFIRAILLMVVFTTILYPVYFGGLNHISNWVGHPIVYHDDKLYMQSGAKIEDVGDVLLKEEAKRKAEEEAKKQQNTPAQTVPTDDKTATQQGNKISENNVFIRFLETVKASFTGEGKEDPLAGLNRLSSGRITIYRAYMKCLNLLGHRMVSKKINGHVVAHAHNNWLQFGYTYGIPAMILYTILTIMAFVYGIRFYLHGHKKYASFCFLPCGIIVGFLAATMTECLFQPFEIYPAFAFWLAFCDIFIKEEK